MKKHIKAQKKLHRIAFKIYQDLVNQLNPIPKLYMEEYDVLYSVLTQQKDDKNKVYSIHEPEVICISKGKEHKQYEFGNKSSFAYTRGSGIIVGAMAIDGNAYDGHTLEPQLEQVKELTGGKIKKAIVDKGYKIKGGIEGLISHLKYDHRMIRNYLSGTAGDMINTLLAATAYNMRKWMRLKRLEILNLIFRWIYQTLILSPVNIQR